MNKNIFISLAIFAFGIVAWLIEWNIIVGYNNFRNEKILYFPFAFFIIISILQCINECIADSKNDRKEDDNKEHFKTILGIATSVIVCISIMVSLPFFKETNVSSYLSINFALAALCSLFWIFFGIFTASSTKPYICTLNNLRKFKSMALLQALGWAGTCITMVVIWRNVM